MRSITSSNIARCLRFAALVVQEHRLLHVVTRLERVELARLVEQLECFVASLRVLVQHRSQAGVASRGVRAQFESAPVVRCRGLQVIERRQVGALQIGIAILGVEL